MTRSSWREPLECWIEKIGQIIPFLDKGLDFGAQEAILELQGSSTNRAFFFFFDVLSYSSSLYVDSNATLIYKLLDSILKCSTPPKSSKLWIFDEKPREGNYSVSNLFTMSSLKYLEHLSQDVFASSLRCLDFFAARVSSNCLWPFIVEVYMNMLTAAPLVKHEFWKLQLEANGHLKLELPKKFSFGITNLSILSQLLHRSTEQQRQETRTLSPSFLSKEQTSVIVHDDTLVAPNHLGKVNPFMNEASSSRPPVLEEQYPADSDDSGNHCRGCTSPQILLATRNYV